LRLKTLQSYADKIYLGDRVQAFIKEYPKAKKVRPKVYISDTCGSDTAGQIWCDVSRRRMEIELSRWILVDRKQTLSTIRHELAHALTAICELGGAKHGKEFTKALKIVSPRTFRRDRHWYDNDSVFKARKKYHPKTRIYGNATSDLTNRL